MVDIIGFFKKKERLVAFILDDVAKLHRKVVKYKDSRFSVRILGEERTFIVDMNYCLRDNNNRPVCMYYINDPRPIKFTGRRTADLDSISLQKVLDDHTIQQMFSNDLDGKLLILMILVGVNILATVIIILIQTKVIKVGGA